MTYTAEYDAQLAALVASVSAVTDVGRVHDRPRYGGMHHWVTQIGGIEQIRAWEISPLPDRVVRTQQAHRHRWRTWEIRGHVSLTDLAIGESAKDDHPGDVHTNASWHLTQRLAGEITDQIELDRLANIAAGTWIHLEPAQKGTPTVEEIAGGAECWGITISVEGYTIVSP